MSYNILIVDDDKEFIEELKDFFYDYEIIKANDGIEALEILQKPNIIDLIILDIKLPGIKGTQLLKEIKKIKPGVYTIILTGYSSENNAIEALKAHADDYLVKSMGIKKIKAVIDELLIERNIRNDLNTDDNGTKIEKIKEYIRRNSDKMLNLNELSDIIFLTPKYISKLFKDYTGESFNDYKLKIKTEKAKDMLLTTTMNIDQISAALGYKNSESLIRVFKKIEKCTPAKFREKNN